MARSPTETSNTRRVLSVGRKQNPQQLAASTATLEAELQEQKAERKKERFLWIVAMTVLVDPLLYKGFDDSTPVFVVVCIIEVIGLATAAQLCGIETAARAYSGLANLLMKNKHSQSHEPAHGTSADGREAPPQPPVGE